MKGSPDVITTLQAGAAREAQLSMQYNLDTRSLKTMGVKQVAKKTDKFAGDAGYFLKCVLKRVQFFGADGSYQIGKVVEQSSVTGLLNNELALEMAVVQPYEEAVQTAMKALDDTTRNLFEHLLKWHQGHVAWLEKQLRLIQGMGETNYISTKL